LIYSVAAAGLTMWALSAVSTPSIMTSRAVEVSASISVLNQGGPPLLASDVPYRSGISVRHLRPVGVSDDQGIYVYLPLLSEATGEDDPTTLMRWLCAGCFALLVLVYPFLFYELFGSVVVSVAAPIMAVLEFGFAVTLDLYWILAWTMLLGIPSLVVAERWWSAGRRRAAVVLMLMLMVAASFATSIRYNAGLPLLIAALGIVLLAGASWRRARHFWQIRRWWLRPLVAGALVVTYLSIATFGFDAIRAYRNHVIHDASFGSASPTQHSTWHNAYIGLGYLPNRYGIEYNDTVSIDAVERARPGTAFLSSAYNAVLRHDYLQIARHDPGFLVNGLWTKLRVVVADAVTGFAPVRTGFWPVLMLLPAAVLVGPRRRSMRVALLVSLPGALLGALAPVITVPIVSYELGWLGTWGALLILGVAWAWVTARDMSKGQWPAELEPLRDRSRGLGRRITGLPAGRAVIAGAVVLVLLFAFARPAPPPSSAALYASQPAPTTASSSPVHVIRSWRFARSLPAGWHTTGGAFTQADGSGLYVRSPMTTIRDQMVGPWIDLPAGRYQLITRGRSLAGGFEVRVERPSGRPLAASGYSWHQVDGPHENISTPFRLRRRARVRFAVSSWSSIPNASAWVLDGMKLGTSSRVGSAAR
jgi:hypothetical protein